MSDPRQIIFDRSLYFPEAVEAAAAAYAGHAKITVTRTADAVVTSFLPGDGYDPELMVNAFCNHALYETILQLRQAGM